jgi:hypothetical protein
MLKSIFYRKKDQHTHEPSRVGLVSPDLAINQDMALHQDRNNLTVSQSILEPVPDDEDQGKALPGLVRTRRWLGSLQHRQD